MLVALLFHRKVFPLLMVWYVQQQQFSFCLENIQKIRRNKIQNENSKFFNNIFIYRGFLLLLFCALHNSLSVFIPPSSCYSRFFPFLYFIFRSFFKLLIEIEEIFSGQTTEYWKIYETWCILERFELRLIWFTDNWLGFFWERVSISGCAEWICFFRIGTGSRSWKVVWLYLLKIGFDSDMLFRGRFWDSVNWGLMRKLVDFEVVFWENDVEFVMETVV